MKLGGILRAAREKANYSQEEFAFLMNMSQSCISKIENDRKVPDALTFLEWFKQTNVQDLTIASFFAADSIAIIQQIMTTLPMFANFFNLLL